VDTPITIFYAALTLFLVMDPVGNIGMWLPILEDVPARRRRWVIVRENVIALAVLAAFLYLGPALLRTLKVQMPALEVAGGVVIFLIALRLIFHAPGGLFGEDDIEGEPLIVPLAIPLLAGPSAITTVMLLSTQADSSATVLAGLGAAWLVGLVILLAAGRISRLLGRRGTAAAVRLMGLLLTVIAVQMFMSGITHYLETIGKAPTTGPETVPDAEMRREVHPRAPLAVRTGYVKEGHDTTFASQCHRRRQHRHRGVQRVDKHRDGHGGAKGSGIFLGL